jgi:hypothetical protein
MPGSAEARGRRAENRIRSTTFLAVPVVVFLAVLGFIVPNVMSERHSPTDFGAVGDGQVDDTAALQRSLDALESGDTLEIPQGMVFRHTDVLTVRVPCVRLAGGGALVATDEARSAVFVDAPHVVLDGITLKVQATSRRWDAYEQMKLRVGPHAGVTVRDVTIEGSAAAGVYVGPGASDFLIEDVRVSSTRADGVHVTGGAYDGVVRRPVVSAAGDDGVAVVSYEADGAPVRRVRIEDATVRGGHWGRGLTVVGGEDVTIAGGRVLGSNAAGLYVASEGEPYWTLAPERVRVTGLVIERANTNPQVEHGAVMVYAGRDDQSPTDVEVSGLTVRHTRPGAPWHVGVLAEPGAQVAGIRFTDVDITGPGVPFVATNVPTDSCTRVRWTMDGMPVPDVVARPR